MTKKDNARVAMFVDGPNLYHMSLKLGYRINFQELLYYLSFDKGMYPVILEYFYDFNPKEKLSDGFMKFLSFLERLSFKNIPVELKSYYGKNLYKDFKSRTDSAINFQAGRYLGTDSFDVVILISGDSDFEYLTKQCHDAGKEVVIIAITEQIANNLYNYADLVICLDKLSAKGKTLLLPIKDSGQEKNMHDVQASS